MVPHMDFLDLQDKWVAVFGVANRRSVAYAVGQLLEAAGAKLVYVVQDPATRDRVRPLLGPAPVFTCDVRSEPEVARLPDLIGAECSALHGLVHSIAYANYGDGVCSFHDTRRADFLEAVDVSCYSLIGIVRALKPLLDPDAAVVTLSISTTRMAAESYGYMGPVKAALDSTVVFLAKSLSLDTRIRVNAVGAGPLKTSSSAGIPGFVDAYLYAERVIPRRRALATEEVAAAVAFLLSRRSSGINGQTIVVDAGMAMNYFDRDIVRRLTAPE